MRLKGSSCHSAVQSGGRHCNRCIAAGAVYARQCTEDCRSASYLSSGFDRLEEFGLYPSGSHVTEKPEILFARLDVKEIVEKADAMFAARQQGERSFEG